MMYFNKKYKLAISAVAIIVAIIFYILIYIQGIYVPVAPYFIPLNQKVNNSLALGIIFLLVFPSIIEYNNYHWFRGIDVNTPLLLNDITESVKSGIPLFRALEDAANRDYGPISKPLKKVIVKLHLGSDLKGALEWLGEELIQPSIKRMTTILFEANESGGDIIDVLNTSVNILKNVEEYKEERYQKTRPYLFIVYLGTIIFLIISWLILTQFFAPLLVTEASPSTGLAGFESNFLDINYYKSILFWASILEAIFGGLVAGKICENQVSAGLIHSVVLLVVTITFFNVFNV